MLKINNEECKIIYSDIKYITCTNHNIEEYAITVKIEMELNNIKGYISFDIDHFNNIDFKNIENKKYVDIPSELNSIINFVEIYDTKNFIDLIESEVVVEFGNIINNSIETKINIDDELIKVVYQGLLNLK